MTGPGTSSGEPPETTDDDDIAAFAEEYDALRAQVAEHEQKMNGLEEISAKLDALLKGNVGGTGSTRQQSTRSQQGAAARGNPQGSGTPQGEPQQAQGAEAPGDEKKPKSEHWYFRDVPWKRN